MKHVHCSAWGRERESHMFCTVLGFRFPSRKRGKVKIQPSRAGPGNKVSCSLFCRHFRRGNRNPSTVHKLKGDKPSFHTRYNGMDSSKWLQRYDGHKRLANIHHVLFWYLVYIVQGDWTGCRDYEAWQEVTFIWQTWVKWLFLWCI